MNSLFLKCAELTMQNIEELESKLDYSTEQTQILQGQIDERDREISGLRLELRTVKTQIDKCDIEIVDLNNIISELRRTGPNAAKDTSMLRHKGYEEVRRHF